MAIGGRNELPTGIELLVRAQIGEHWRASEPHKAGELRDDGDFGRRGQGASTSDEDMDAMFRPRPYGAIAIDPLRANSQQPRGNVNA